MLCFATNGPGLTSAPLRPAWIRWATLGCRFRSAWRGRSGVGTLCWLVGRHVAGAGLSLDFRRLPHLATACARWMALVDDRRHSSPDRCRPLAGWLACCAVVALVWGSSCCVGTFASFPGRCRRCWAWFYHLLFVLTPCPMRGRLGVATDGNAAATAFSRTAESAWWRWPAFAARSASLAVLMATRSSFMPASDGGAPGSLARVRGPVGKALNAARFRGRPQSFASPRSRPGGRSLVFPAGGLGAKRRARLRGRPQSFAPR
jgi:hypothetical protein